MKPISGTGLSCCAKRSWTVYKRWVTKSWPAMEAALPTEFLPQLWCGMLRPGPPKNGEECVNYFVSKTAMLLQTDVKLCTRDGWLTADPWWSRFHPLSTSTEKPGESVKLFSKLDYLAMQSRFWNAFQRWVKSCWLMNLAALNGSWTMYQRSLTSCWPIMESAWPVKPLPHSWSDIGLFIRGTCILIGFFLSFFL